MDAVVPTLHFSLVEQEDELQETRSQQGKLSRFTVSVSEDNYRALDVLTCHCRFVEGHDAHSFVNTAIQRRDASLSEKLTERYFEERLYARAMHKEWSDYIEVDEFKVAVDENQLLQEIVEAAKAQFKMSDLNKCRSYLEHFIDDAHKQYSDEESFDDEDFSSDEQSSAESDSEKGSDSEFQTRELSVRKRSALAPSEGEPSTKK